MGQSVGRDDCCSSREATWEHAVGRDPSSHGDGIWSVPVAGGVPQLMVRFDDPSRPRHHFGVP